MKYVVIKGGGRLKDSFMVIQRNNGLPLTTWTNEADADRICDMENRQARIDAEKALIEACGIADTASPRRTPL